MNLVITSISRSLEVRRSLPGFGEAAAADCRLKMMPVPKKKALKTTTRKTQRLQTCLWVVFTSKGTVL